MADSIETSHHPRPAADLRLHGWLAHCPRRQWLRKMANQSFLNDPKHWRDRAEEARTRADQLDDPQSKSAMLRIANDYVLLAERAEARASGHSPKSN
jgi:hypothetical protein